LLVILPQRLLTQWNWGCLPSGTGAAYPAEGVLLFPELLYPDAFIADAFIADAISNLGLLAQDEVAQDRPALVQILENPLTPLVGLFFLFYFIFILPEKRKKKEEKRMMSTLKKNDRIVTIGGIHGTVVAAPADSKVVTIRIDESSNARVKLNRSAIASIVVDKESQESKHKEPDSVTKDK
jgi:preprotein translocase subunit YajC